jgi:hypothetical protein
VPLNSSALRTSERSQILARTARLNGRELHGRAASGALRPLVLCVEHGIASVRRSEFSGEPTGCFRFEGIRCNDACLDMIAVGTFEQPVFEAYWSGRNMFQHHPCLAAGAARALNSGQELFGGGHDASLRWAGALPDSLSSIVADGGTMMESAYASQFGSPWSILLSYHQTFTHWGRVSTGRTGTIAVYAACLCTAGCHRPPASDE